MILIKAPIIRIPQISIRIMRKDSLKHFFYQYYPLAAILISYIMIAFFAGPYQNGDTAWEYEAVSGVLKYGLPYAYGMHLIDQPPLGFYLSAAFFSTFGASISNGTLLVTLFGLGCIILVYFIGEIAYNRTTGFFAALLFAFSPWHILISRCFLIDVPCLFFSLLAILLSLFAVKRWSLALFTFSGVVFAAAFSTKLYSVFSLIPIMAIFLLNRPKKITSLLFGLVAFSVPTLISSYLWYEMIAGIGLSSIFLHADLLTQNPSLQAPTYFFVSNFLVSYGLGWLFIDAVILSLLIGLFYRHLFYCFFIFDSISLAVILCVTGVNTILGAALDLKSPFLNAFKYDYQALPFFCLIGASLINKSLTLFKVSKEKKKYFRTGLIALSILGIFIVSATFFYNIDRIQLFSRWDYFIFRVAPSVDVGYSIFNSTPLPNNLLIFIQVTSLCVLLSGILCISRHKLSILFNLIWRKINAIE